MNYVCSVKESSRFHQEPDTTQHSRANPLNRNRDRIRIRPKSGREVTTGFIGRKVTQYCLKLRERMKVSRILILLLIALLYWTFYYLFSWKFIPHIESWLLSRYIPLKESERFQPFLTRSPNNLFDFTAFNDPMASRVSSPITNLSLVMIQPSDYVELHNNGREEDDLFYRKMTRSSSISEAQGFRVLSPLLLRPQ